MTRWKISKFIRLILSSHYGYSNYFRKFSCSFMSFRTFAALLLPLVKYSETVCTVLAASNFHRSEDAWFWDVIFHKNGVVFLQFRSRSDFISSLVYVYFHVSSPFFLSSQKWVIRRKSVSHVFHRLLRRHHHRVITWLPWRLSSCGKSLRFRRRIHKLLRRSALRP